jgi:hypothetical protein
MAQMFYLGHTIQADVIHYEDIGQYHGGCVITRPDGSQSGRIACNDPMYTRSEKEALQLSLKRGVEVISAGVF